MVGTAPGFKPGGRLVTAMRHPVTPDGRYFVVRARLWRCTDPALPAAERTAQTRALMAARRDKGLAMRAGDEPARRAAQERVDAAKRALGERGPPWWTDGAPDWNRHLVRNTPYRAWFEELPP